MHNYLEIFFLYWCSVNENESEKILLTWGKKKRNTLKSYVQVQYKGWVIGILLWITWVIVEEY